MEKEEENKEKEGEREGEGKRREGEGGRGGVGVGGGGGCVYGGNKIHKFHTNWRSGSRDTGVTNHELVISVNNTLVCSMFFLDDDT